MDQSTPSEEYIQQLTTELIRDLEHELDVHRHVEMLKRIGNSMLYSWYMMYGAQWAMTSPDNYKR